MRVAQRAYVLKSLTASDQTCIAGLHQAVLMIHEIVQPLAQQGSALFFLQPVDDGIEAVKLAGYAAGATAWTTTASWHGLASPYSWLLVP